METIHCIFQEILTYLLTACNNYSTKYSQLTVVQSPVFTGQLVYACVVVKLIFRNDNSLITRRELTSIN